MDPTGEYTVSVISSTAEISEPESLCECARNPVPGSPFRSLGDALKAARQESSIVVVRLGAPVPGFFFSAGTEELPGLQLSRLPDRAT
jgi:hypothetical protein